MAYSLTVTDKPQVEPVSLDEARAHLGFWGDDREDYLKGLISAARQELEVMVSRAVTTTQYLYTMPRFPRGQWITVPRAQLVSVESIHYVDGNTEERELFSSDQYQVDTQHRPGRVGLERGGNWPHTSTWAANPVQVIYTAGFPGQIPHSLKQAILILLRYYVEGGELGTPVSPQVRMAVDHLVYLEDWGHYV